MCGWSTEPWNLFYKGLEVIQHWQVQRRLVSSGNKCFHFQISKVALWGLQRPSKEFHLPLSFYYHKTWNLACPRYLLFGEITWTPSTPTPFSFADLSYCQYLQGWQVAILHAKQVIQRCCYVWIASLWIQNVLWGRVGGMFPQQLQKKLCHNL